MEVQHGSERKELPLIVTRGQLGPSLLGRNWLGELKLDWKAIHQTQEPSALATTLDAHRNDPGHDSKTPSGPTSSPMVIQTMTSTILPTPEDELERLEKEGIIHPRQFSNWAAPIVPVLKADSSVKICGDYKVTANKAVKVGALVPTQYQLGPLYCHDW